MKSLFLYIIIFTGINMLMMMFPQLYIILIIGIVIFYAYYFRKIKKNINNQKKFYQNYTYNQNDFERKKDVIDVEFSEEEL